jgi:DNA-binding NarL/FixJ family response regulator
MANGPIRVVIVEDSEPIRKGLTSTIRNDAKGLSLVEVFEAGDAAIAKVEEGLAFDVALVDLGLPGASGFDVIRAMRARNPDAIAIVLTIWDDPANVVNAMRAGARGYLLKDATPDRIRAAIRDAATGGMPLGPSVARFIVDGFLKGTPAARDAKDPRDSGEPPGEPLTPREHEVLELLARGLTYADVARNLAIGVGTVQSHVKRIYEKLEVTSKAEATAVAIRRGLVDP